MTLRVKGMQVKIGYGFISVMALLIILTPKFNGFACFLFCVLHELGHLFAMFISKNKPSSITLGCYGMKIVSGRRLISPAYDIAIIIAGPCVNFALAVLFNAIGAERLCEINLALGIFNMLPVQMLDGGKIIYIVFHNENVSKKIGIITSCIILLLGIAVIIKSKTNFTLLIVSIYLLLGTINATKPQD